MEREAKAAKVTPEMRAEQARQDALRLLPRTFDSVRHIFGLGRTGPCVKPRAEVLALIRERSTLKSGLSAADAAGQLQLLLELAPECFQQEAPSALVQAVGVRMLRKADFAAARRRLQALATGQQPPEAAVAVVKHAPGAAASSLAAGNGAAAAAASDGKAVAPAAQLKLPSLYRVRKAGPAPRKPAGK